MKGAYRAVFLLCALLGSILSVFAAPFDKCTQTEADFDNCASQMSVFNREDDLIPTIEAEMDTYCKGAIDALKCMRLYARTCMPEYAKTVVGMYQYDFKRDMKKRCQTKEGRAEFMKHMQCPKEKGVAALKMCNHNFDAQLEWILTNLPKEDQVLVSCCAMHWIHHCIVNTTTKMCSDPKTAKYFDDAIGDTISEGVDYHCGKYRSYEDCGTHMEPEQWKKLLEIGEDPAKVGFTPKNKSPVTTMVKLFSQFN